MSRHVQSLSEQLRRLSRMNGIEAHREQELSQRSIRKRWSWNDRSGNGRMTVRRCNKPDVMGRAAAIFAGSWVTVIRC
nr:hypothetical protein [Pantoea stewartii]